MTLYSLTRGFVGARALISWFSPHKRYIRIRNLYAREISTCPRAVEWNRVLLCAGYDNTPHHIYRAQVFSPFEYVLRFLARCETVKLISCLPSTLATSDNGGRWVDASKIHATSHYQIHFEHSTRITFNWLSRFLAKRSRMQLITSNRTLFVVVRFVSVCMGVFVCDVCDPCVCVCVSSFIRFIKNIEFC